jgi:hypothetical protein
MMTKEQRDIAKKNYRLVIRRDIERPSSTSESEFDSKLLLDVDNQDRSNFERALIFDLENPRLLNKLNASQTLNASVLFGMHKKDGPSSEKRVIPID